MNRIGCLLIYVLALASAALAKIELAASVPDLASIAASVGGDRVEVFSIARGTSDPHSVEVLPSYMVRVSRAGLYLKVGLGLDQWADQIIDGARNSRIRVIDCSKDIRVLEKPVGKVDASQGDVHPDGNPHYWLDPANGAVIARTIAAALTAADPAGADLYAANLAAFQTGLAQNIEQWKSALAALNTRGIITYHSSWPYFADAFELHIVERIEPVPGIPPTGAHLAALVRVIREQHVQVVLQEPYFSDDAALYLSRETGVRVLKVAPSCDGTSAGAYAAHVRQLVDALTGAQ